MIVMKFGGTSLAGAAQIRQVGAIVRRFVRSRPVVVVSAMAGVTHELIALARPSVSGLPREVSRRLHRLQRSQPPEAPLPWPTDRSCSRPEPAPRATFTELH